jgi:signal transduction histidine kinase
VRRWARRLADRLVYGKRATPYEVLAEFSERLGTTYADEDVTARMAQLLREATGADAAHVWLSVGGRLQPVASAPSAAPQASWPTDGVDVHYRGEKLGGLSVVMPANDPLDPTRAKLITDLAAQAGPVLENVRLIEELRASRRRIVSSQDERAKKLERDIHDGAQQQLVALTVKLRLLEQIAERDGAKAKQMAAELQTDATGALEDLRDLARGIYPPLLADKGLGAALEAQARKAAIPITVSANDLGRFSPEVESAVYFSCLEALQNVAKYAEATTATIELSNGSDELRLSVSDDGRGFDAATTSYGTGLQGIADRLAAIGGTLTVESAPGQGTTISGVVPS